MKKSLFVIFLLALFVIPTVFSFAQEFNYVPLSGITDPQGNPILGETTLPATFDSLYKIGMGIVFTLAFLSFLYAGWQYVGSDLITDKSKGKERLWNTTIGVGIALSGFVLLNTINPDILSFRSLDLSIEKPASQSSFLENLLFRNTPKTTDQVLESISTKETSLGLTITQADPSVTGLKKDDVIKSINGYSSNSLQEVANQLRDCGGRSSAISINNNGDTLCSSSVIVQREGKDITVLVETKIASPATLESFIAKLNPVEDPVRKNQGESGIRYTNNFGALASGDSIRAIDDEWSGWISLTNNATKFTTPEEFKKVLSDYVKNCPWQYTNKLSNGQRYCNVQFATWRESRDQFIQGVAPVPILIPAEY